jgi:uncharacterized membrane protein YkgB
MNFKQRLTSNQILAISIGLVYLWFGGLKFFAGQSPAEDLAKNTMDALTFGILPSSASIILLAIWESLIGILMLANIYRKATVSIALIHMAFTFTPLILFPEMCFNESAFSFTLLGQYIFKNVIIIAALLTLYNKK